MSNWRLKLDKPAASLVARKDVTKLVSKTTRQTFNRSQVLVPVDTGLLRASGTSDVSTFSRGVKGTITYTARYAAAVHNGRGPLTIRPKSRRRGKKGVLRFEIGGQIVYARSVFQHARAGRPYLLNALEQVAGGNGFRVRQIAYVR